MRRTVAAVICVVGIALAVAGLPLLFAGGTMAVELRSTPSGDPFGDEGIVLEGHAFYIGGRFLTARQFFALTFGVPAALITLGVAAIVCGISLWRGEGRSR